MFSEAVQNKTVNSAVVRFSQSLSRVQLKAAWLEAVAGFSQSAAFPTHNSSNLRALVTSGAPSAERNSILNNGQI